MTLWVVRVLGWLVIVHGLSHAVLPLRGSTAPALLIGDWVPVGLYVLAMVGFVVAGLGLLGLRPLDAAISPLLVLSSGLSLVAITRFGDPTLLAGGVVDVGLLIVGLWRGYGGPHIRDIIPYFTRSRSRWALPSPAMSRLRRRWSRGIVRPRPRLDHPRDRENRGMVLDGRGAFVLVPTPTGSTPFIIRSKRSDTRFPVWAAGLQIRRVRAAAFHHRAPDDAWHQGARGVTDRSS